jgi:hypothetical protein
MNAYVLERFDGKEWKQLGTFASSSRAEGAYRNYSSRHPDWPLRLYELMAYQNGSSQKVNLRHGPDDPYVCSICNDPNCQTPSEKH